MHYADRSGGGVIKNQTAGIADDTSDIDRPAAGADQRCCGNRAPADRASAIQPGDAANRRGTSAGDDRAAKIVLVKIRAGSIGTGHAANLACIIANGDGVGRCAGRDQVQVVANNAAHRLHAVAEYYRVSGADAGDQATVIADIPADIADPACYPLRWLSRQR